jgi:hypothetical protein
LIRDNQQPVPFPVITAWMISCAEREEIRRQTLANLLAAGWSSPVRVVLDRSTAVRRQQRIEETAHTLLQRALAERAELILFLEDDLIFNYYLIYNLTCWMPLRQHQAGCPFFASLYNPNIREINRVGAQNYFIADPDAIYGGQAFILSASTIAFALSHWDDVPGMQDIKLPRLAARLGPIYYHSPSLVQHVGSTSTWGGPFHRAYDFDIVWRAPAHSGDLGY